MHIQLNDCFDHDCCEAREDRSIPGGDLAAVKSTLENDSTAIKIVDNKNAQWVHVYLLKVILT